MSLSTLPIPRSPSPRPTEARELLDSTQTQPSSRANPTDRRIALVADFQAIFKRDPAARNWLEVLLCSPGLHALAGYRVAHWLHNRGLQLLPRFISHIVRGLTGIEIHPGAQIGRGVTIDHGMGVVIGETAIVGDDALIYQGVTLGGTGKETGKRHPTLGNQVVVGAGAKILGNIHIGDFARIGAGTIVLRDVPAHCTAVGVPSRNLCHSQDDSPSSEQRNTADTEVSMQQLLQRIEQLENEVKAFKTQSDLPHFS